LLIASSVAKTAGSGLRVNLTGLTQAGGTGTAAGIIVNLTGTSYNTQRFIRFTNTAGTEIGSINNSSASATAFSTSSDRRLKDNIAETHFNLSDLMKIGVEDFSWKSDGLHDTGFIAQDLYKVYPNAVTKGDNGDEPYVEGVTNTWSIDYGKVTPIIVKAIQDQQKLLGSFTLIGTDLSALVNDLRSEKPQDAVEKISGKIAAGEQFLTDLSVARLTAVRGYFDETFAGTAHEKKLCLGDVSASAETCVSKEDLDKLLAAGGIQTSAAATPAQVSIPAVVSGTNDLNMNGFSIGNVLALNGINGNWSIDERGLLTVAVKTDGVISSLYAMTGANAEVVLSGSLKLEAGHGRIIFAKEQKDVMAVGVPYRVNVTMTDSSNGVYVSGKSTDGFDVIETMGGASGATFDWMVIARRVGYENANDFGLTPDQTAAAATINNQELNSNPAPTQAPVVVPPADTIPTIVVPSSTPTDTTPTDTTTPVASTSTDTTTSTTTTSTTDATTPVDPSSTAVEPSLTP
jgi:hypothetical protein